MNAPVLLSRHDSTLLITLNRPERRNAFDLEMRKAIGEAVFTAGPYLASPEYVAGFWIIKAANLDEALRLAAAGSKACNRRVEVRAFNGG